MYIAEALQGSIKQRIYSQSESQRKNEEMSTKPCSDIMNRNGHAVNGAQIDGEVKDGNKLMLSRRKTRCSSSRGKKPLKKRERTCKMMPFFIVKPRCKPVKKHCEFRRRTGKPIESSTVDGHGDSKRVSMARTVS